MRIFAADHATTPQLQAHPFILLIADRWDDFGFKTQFQAVLHESPHQIIDVGSVKILRRGLRTSSDPQSLPSGEIELDAEYVTLGQALSYYEKLKSALSRSDFISYLEKMQDAAFLPDHAATFKDEKAFEISLLRDGGARRALQDAKFTIYGTEQNTQFSFSFSTSVGGSSFLTRFQFGEPGPVPSRINALIGYNGVGKTRFLANLAHIAWRDASERSKSGHGRLEPSDIAFGRVLAISYSAFDTFETPFEVDANGRTEIMEYVYCGLRDVQSHDDRTRLRSVDELSRDLAGALLKISELGRLESLRSALEPLLREPSFQLSAMEIDLQKSDWLKNFNRLSTGHKISLNIVVQIVAQLEKNSLVLMDEPESHLHPPLLAALMRSVGEALSETGSFAVIATHSPVVLQEIAARHVHVIRRYGDRTEVERLSEESFGENVGILTRTVFNLDNSDSEYEGILREIGSTVGYSGALELFPDGLSSQALGIVMAAEARPAVFTPTESQ